MSVINTHIFGRFKSVSCTVSQRFGDPERFQRLMSPGVRLCVCCQHSQFWPILTCFADYYSPFWGPVAISIVIEPQDVLTCWSTTLAVLADSGPFHGLLLTVFGSQSDFHGCRTPRCAYMSVINNRVFVDFDPFRGLLLTILGSQSDFHGCRTARCAYVLVVKTRCLGRFWPIPLTITR